MAPHGLMFHHFHDEDLHPKVQGSINCEDLSLIIDSIGLERFITPNEWLQRSSVGTLGSGDMCLTFDDGLRCQYDIALPVLEARGLKAFFFVYTSALCGESSTPCPEVHRWFRTTCFDKDLAFYEAFYECAAAMGYANLKARAESDEEFASFLAEYSFYSNDDRAFRFVRDKIIPKDYYEVMESLLKERGIDSRAVSARLMMDPDCLRDLERRGHAVGLHSHTHPFMMSRLEEREQRFEYETNFNLLSSILNTKPWSVSHPCGSYSEEGLAILRSLGIRVGFNSSMSVLYSDDRVKKTDKALSSLEFLRADHTNVLRQVKANARYREDIIPWNLRQNTLGNRKPTITIITSNHLRHLAFIRQLSKVASTVYAIIESTTIYPGRTEHPVYKKSKVMEEYMSKVISAEQQVFGNDRFTPANVRSLVVAMGDLNQMDLDNLAPALRSDYYIVFGASYLKGPLVEVLVENSCLNCHLGVSPYYRGASCNFWALADGRPDMVGGTVHLLTKGLDSGPMLYHAKPKPWAYDAFELGMCAVEAVQHSVCDRIADGSIHEYVPMAQDKDKEMRYSRYTDFTDEVAAKFLADPPSPESIRASLEHQDMSLFSNLYTKQV